MEMERVVRSNEVLKGVGGLRRVDRGAFGRVGEGPTGVRATGW